MLQVAAKSRVTWPQVGSALWDPSRIVKVRGARDTERSIIWGAHIHVFVFTDCKNNRF